MCNECRLSIDKDGDVVFLNDEGQWHCLDGPAIITPNYVGYIRHGKFHRDGDAPAFIWIDGDVEYWKNGMRHRDGDEPAVIYASGRIEYWVNGEFVRYGHV